MLTIQNTAHFRIEAPSIVTIGTFDGVHQGHQKILKRLGELRAKSGLQTVVFTFDPHPRKVLFPHQTDLKLLSTTDEKVQLLESCGVDVTVVFPFTTGFAGIDAGNYIKDILVKQLHVKQLVIGYDHKFGLNRSGDIHTLKKYASQYNYVVEEISAHDVDDLSVSSSRIRKALEAGRVEEAASLLGYSYSINSKVVRGKQMGRTLGYPTANLNMSIGDKLIPRQGVYFVRVTVAGKKYYGMMNIGTNPTTDQDNKVKCEVNIFDFDQEIYGTEIKVEFLRWIREEKKFPALNELVSAIDNDKEECLKLIMVTG